MLGMLVLLSIVTSLPPEELDTVHISFIWRITFYNLECHLELGMLIIAIHNTAYVVVYVGALTGSARSRLNHQ